MSDNKPPHATQKLGRSAPSLIMTSHEIKVEVENICRFIAREAGEASLVVGVSGGIDSDVCARLCARSMGASRVKLFTVLQADMEDSHINNAHNLSKDLSVQLVILKLRDEPKRLVETLRDADPVIEVDPDDLLDIGKSKNSLRTWVKSMYAEKGYLIVGTANRTELETGFYLPFGDGLAHIQPLAHLFKTQVKQIARTLGTREEVIVQHPSAGYWPGETDLNDLAYWLYHERPVSKSLYLANDELSIVTRINQQLSFKSLDTALLMLSKGLGFSVISRETGLELDTIQRLSLLVENARHTKGRALNMGLPTHKAVAKRSKT